MRAVRHLGFALICGLLPPVLGLAQQGAQLPPLSLQQPVATQLIQNGDFEDPDSTAWSFSDWPPRPDTGANLIANSIFYTEDVARSGRRALCLDLTTVGEDRILLCQQRIAGEVLAPHDGRRARMSAWVLLGRGPAGYQAGYAMRHWGPPGAPPIDSRSLNLPASVDEWAYHELEFTLRMGETTRADVTVSASQVPDLAQSPVVYVDDVRLEVMGTPDLDARLLSGVVLMAPDSVLALRVAVSEEAWEAGKRSLRWDITSPDGLTGYAEGDVALTSRVQIAEPVVPELPEGEYAVRLALGGEPGARDAELLLPFRRVDGPFANR